jgi:hypothetical protein
MTAVTLFYLTTDISATLGQFHLTADQTALTTFPVCWFLFKGMVQNILQLIYAIICNAFLAL